MSKERDLFLLKQDTLMGKLTPVQERIVRSFKDDEVNLASNASSFQWRSISSMMGKGALFFKYDLYGHGYIMPTPAAWIAVGMPEKAIELRRFVADKLTSDSEAAT